MRRPNRTPVIAPTTREIPTCELASVAGGGMALDVSLITAGMFGVKRPAPRPGPIGDPLDLETLI